MIFILPAIFIAGIWLISKFAPPRIVAAVCFVFAIGGLGTITGFAALIMLFLTLARIFGPRVVVGDETLVTCPACGRKVSPETKICPRCELHLPKHAENDGGHHS